MSIGKAWMKAPHPLVLLYCIVLFAYGLTWVLPSGAYETTVNETGAELVVPGSFKLLEEDKNLPIWTILTVIPRGLAAAQGVIFFVLILGGSLAIIRSTGAIDASIGWLINRFKYQPIMLVLLLVLSMAIGASTFGMAEETIPLVAILVILCVKLRMDAIVAVSVILVGNGIGYGAAAINPFTIVIAQDIAGLPLLSGLGFRLLMFVPFFLIGFFHIWRYAVAIRKDPSVSLLHDSGNGNSEEAQPLPPMTNRHWLIVFLCIAALALVVWGSVAKQWHTTEMSAIFIGLAMVIGVVGHRPLEEMAVLFTRGAAELAGTAIIIGIAQAISIPLSDADVIHTVVYGLSLPLTQLGPELSAVGMFLTQSILNFFMPSGSGQAYVTMPLMAPISDVAGVSRQVAVLAFQMGDGFSNMIVPTSGVLVGVLGITKVPYGKWFRFIWPLMLQLTIAGAITIALAVWIGYK